MDVSDYAIAIDQVRGRHRFDSKLAGQPSVGVARAGVADRILCEKAQRLLLLLIEIDGDDLEILRREVASHVLDLGNSR